MSKTRDERVSDALSQLVDRALPPNDDEAIADERFYRALDSARDIIERAEPTSIQPDVNHIADLIKRKLVRENNNPDQALKFGNLFSRLLSQPVLSQKWAILYLIYLLSDSDSGSTNTNGLPLSSGTFGLVDRAVSRTSAAPPVTRSPIGARSISDVDNPRHSLILDEAFSRPGLPSLPNPRERRERISRPPPAARRKEQEQPDGDVRDEDGMGYADGQHNINEPSEAVLLRDLPFTLQGVSTAHLTFPTTTTLNLPSTLPPPIISLLYALAEPSLLYKTISQFIDSSDNGLVGQSLRAAIGNESRSYLALVATLEGHIRRALAQLDDQQSRKGLGKAGVTLKRCVIWTREATMGLRLMTLIVEQSKSRRGGQLISLIHSFATSHGDPFVGAFAERLLVHVTRPFYEMLRLWIYDGELSDPYNEFFVSERHLGDEDGRATSVWEDKYKLDSDMIPSIMTEDFAKKVFLIGKSLSFIRHVCGDAAWVESYSKEASRELRYGDTATLSASISTAYQTTMARLLHLLNHKFALQDHLHALKKYLLLAQGDFIALLMESLATNLDRPANSQYRHTLTAQLEHAIRNSNAQHDSADVLRRLDARMLELSHGEIGWDVFTLEYKIDAPIDVIVTPHASKQYLKVFNLLWRVKRVEYALGATWRRCMTGARTGVLPAVSLAPKSGTPDPLAADWKAARCTISEMNHFTSQLQYYILSEVIESSWTSLQRALAHPSATLDDLIAAHAAYLRAITRKGLLGGAAHGIDFPAQLHELLKGMLAYREAVEGLYACSVGLFARKRRQEERVEARTRAGGWGVTEHDDDDGVGTSSQRDPKSPVPPALLAGGASDALPALRQRLAELADGFRTRVCALLGDLAYQPDTDMRFLGVVMNFNDAYKVVRKSRRREREKGTRREGEGERVGGAHA